MNLNEYRYRRTVGAMGFALLIYLVLFDLFSLFLTLLAPSFLQIFFSADSLGERVAYQILYAAGYLFCFMFPVFFFKLFVRKAGYPYQPMYAPMKLSPWLPLIVLAGITVVFSAASVNSWFMELIGYSTEEIYAVADAQEDPAVYELVLEFMVVCLVPGFCEEFLFRGAILTNCLPFGRGTAIVISSLLFSLMHRNAEQIFYAFAAGIFLGILYVRTGSIWNGVILHTVNNFISCTEGTILARVKDDLLALTYVSLLELLIFSLGIISLVILILKFFSEKEPRLQEGFFGKDLPASYAYAECSINPKRAFRLFWTPSMVIFLSLCLVQIVFLILIVWVGGIFIGSVG